MESLANLECFVRSAELRGFSAAARRLGLTPAAVSRNVAMLERNLGIRLFHRSTRKLALTDEGERLLQAIGGTLDALRGALAEVAPEGQPAGQLKVSLSLDFGIGHILPLLPDFVRQYPRVRPDLHFESRQVDLIGEGYDAAIGGGFELSGGLTTRVLAPLHIIAAASPAFMRGRPAPVNPSDLAALDAVVMRSQRTGRVSLRVMRDIGGTEMAAAQPETIVVTDSSAMARAAELGLGVALLAVPDALPYLERGALIRLLPRWYADLGSISLYYASKTMLPGKTRAFIDHVADAFRRERLAERFAGSLG
ncbi:MAG: LysR substrate-binding domain-containing protein [Pseudorhodoplanes sp.]|uniref:LysR family transcriptional regulator n=1 Tax=Pseudorhodoplanes sp. TaxID=1934341 RepID=UPI003D0B0BE5